MNVHELAEKYVGCFELKTRDNGDRFYCIADEKESKELTRLIQDAHGDMFPDDYKYQYILDTLIAVSECETEEQAEERQYEIEADVYTSDLLKWVSSNLTRSCYVDEALEEYGSAMSTLFMALNYGQTRERCDVYSSVLTSLQSLCEEKETT